MFVASEGAKNLCAEAGVDYAEYVKRYLQILDASEAQHPVLLDNLKKWLGI